jgi:ketosteroid isomerase-like protein
VSATQEEPGAATPPKLAFRTAMEARDLAAIVAEFAPDAILYSPLTSGLAFTGREQIRAVTEVILEVFGDFRYTEEMRGQDAAFLVSRATVGGQDIEMADHLRFSPDGKIRELTVFFRPLPAATAALSLIAAGLGRRKSPVRAAVMSALTRPLAYLTRAGDGIGVRLVRSCL